MSLVQKEIRTNFEWHGKNGYEGHAVFIDHVPCLWPRIALAAAIILFIAAFAHAGPCEQVAVAEAVVYANQNAEPALTPDRYTSATNPRIEFTPQSTATPADEIDWNRYTRSTLQRSVDEQKPLLVVLGAEWCQPCHKLDDETFIDRNVIELVESSMIAVHIDIDQERELAQAFNVKTIPLVLVIEPNEGHTIRRKQVGYQSPQQMLTFLSDVEQKSASYAASGPAGTIHASPQIRQVLDWWRSNIGDGVKAEMRWDRSGAQSFPLLAKGDWSAVAILGQYGRFQLSAKGAVGLPVDEANIGYEVNGDDIATTGKVVWPGMAKKLNPSQETNSQAVQPAQLDPMTVLTIASVVRGIWQLLNPHVSLTLGGNVTASAVMSNDAILIEFQQAPSVKIESLFNFDLGVRSVQISESNVHVEFSGSRWIKSRDFNVE